MNPIPEPPRPAPTDVTGFRPADAALLERLQASEERLRIVAHATTDVLWDWEAASDRTWWSDGYASTFGHACGASADSGSWSDHLHPDDRDRVLAGLAAAMRGAAGAWRDEYRLAAPGRGYRRIADQATILRDGRGQVLRMVGSMTDVTEQRRQEEQRRQSQRLDAVGQLTGGVAHDFNNLLTVILGNAEQLAEDLREHEALRHLAQMTVQAAERAAQLTSQLQAFARIQPLAPQPTDVDRHVAAMQGRLRRTLGAHIALELGSGPGPCRAMVDPDQLENALLSLCINARDAMEEGGRLTVETACVDLQPDAPDAWPDVQPGRYVMVAVTDTGKGMDAATLASVFEPFFTTKDIGRGSGLGLSMVHGFAQQSDGQVRIHSQPGHGTSVRLYLPLADGPPAGRVDA